MFLSIRLLLAKLLLCCELEIRQRTAVSENLFRAACSSFGQHLKNVMNGNSLGDSSAVSIPGRVLPQHHTAVTLLGAMIAAHPEAPFDWLDLASGRGQIIAHLEDTLPDPALRGKIRYLGYDINNDYARETEWLASQLKFAQSRVITGELGHFSRICKPDETFSFISFTNVVHELPPVLFGELFLQLILRLKPDGMLYIYDMELLPDPELGAVPWDAADVRRLLMFIFKELGAKAAAPMVQRWPHATCTAWSVQLDRKKLDVDTQSITNGFETKQARTAAFITDLFREKLQRTIELLEELTLHGGQTGEEQKKKTKLLYDFWSLSRLQL